MDLSDGHGAAWCGAVVEYPGKVLRREAAEGRPGKKKWIVKNVFLDFTDGLTAEHMQHRTTWPGSLSPVSAGRIPPPPPPTTTDGHTLARKRRECVLTNMETIDFAT